MLLELGLFVRTEYNVHLSAFRYTPLAHVSMINMYRKSPNNPQEDSQTKKIHEIKSTERDVQI
jgi:hypothetical protein